MTISDLKDDALLRPDQVADILNVTRKTVYNWINQGKLAAVMVGPRGIRVKKKDVANLITDVDET